jgi:hypothetical protein
MHETYPTNSFFHDFIQYEIHDRPVPGVWGTHRYVVRTERPIVPLTHSISGEVGQDVSREELYRFFRETTYLPRKELVGPIRTREVPCSCGPEELTNGTYHRVYLGEEVRQSSSCIRTGGRKGRVK